MKRAMKVVDALVLIATTSVCIYGFFESVAGDDFKQMALWMAAMYGCRYRAEEFKADAR